MLELSKSTGIKVLGTEKVEIGTCTAISSKLVAGNQNSHQGAKGEYFFCSEPRLQLMIF